MSYQHPPQEGTLAGIGQELGSIVDVLPIELADEAMNRARAAVFALSVVMGREAVIGDIIWCASDVIGEAIRHLSEARIAIQTYSADIGLAETGSGDDGLARSMRPGRLSEGVLSPAYGAYPRDPEHGMGLEEADMPECGNPEHNARIAQAHVMRALPGTRAVLLSDEGATATVLRDADRVYKVFRCQPEDYSDVESEMVNLTVLSKEGVAPRPVVLIDASPDTRCNHGDSRNMFGGRQRIVRMAGNRHLPIIVSELIDAGPIDELPVDFLTAEFDKLLDVAARHDLIYKDCSIWYDRRNNRAILLDVGEVCHTRHERVSIDEAGKKLRKHFPNYTDSQVINIMRMEDLMRELLPSHLQGGLQLVETAQIFEAEGISGIHSWLLRRRGE